MDSEGMNGEYIVMDSEVKVFMITEGVILCVRNVHIEVLHGMELNDLLHCGTEGRYVNGRMDMGLEIAATGQRWLDLKLRMKPWLVTQDTGNVMDLFVLVGSFRPTSRRRVRDHVNNACLRDILMRSGSRQTLAHG